MAFDTLDLARAVALHPLKVIVGIGHHADRSVLDELAHSEKTPTAVGQFLVSQVQESWETVLVTVGTICDRSQAMIDGEQQRLRGDQQRLLMRAGRAVAIAADRCEAQGIRCRRQLVRTIRQEKEALLTRLRLWKSRISARTNLEKVNWGVRIQRLRSAATKQLVDGRTSLQQGRERLDQVAATRLEMERERLEVRQRRNRAADPRNVLGRGYAWIKNAAGETVRETGDVTTGDRIHIRLKDGSVDAHVD